MRKTCAQGADVAKSSCAMVLTLFIPSENKPQIRLVLGESLLGLFVLRSEISAISVLWVKPKVALELLEDDKARLRRGPCKSMALIF